MPALKDVQNYGVWFARPIKYDVETKEDDPKSPHIHLTFRDDSQENFTAAINIKSGDRKESRLVYWFNDDMHASFIDDFKGLKPGFHSLEGNTKGLDYLRDDGLFDQRKGEILDHDIDGENNDIIDKLTPLLKRSVNEKATIHIFGSQFGGKKSTGKQRGIHNVHMNQGSLPKYSNGVQQDGAMFFHFEDEDQWVGVFLAFASQRVPTDNETGQPLPNARSWANILKQEEEEF